MLNKKIIFNFIALAVAVSGVAWAANVSYPIPELGNCGSKEECKAYCNEPNNQEACMAWAGNNGVVKQEDVQRFQKIKQMEKGEVPFGPGGCRGREECDAFCSDSNNAEECLKYSADQGFIQKEEIERTMEVIQEGGPGGCKSREECDAFCKNPENQEVCIADAVKHGSMTQEEADFLSQMQNRQKQREMKKPKKPQGPDINKERAEELMQKPDFKGPGGCKNDAECKAYCDGFEHTDECLSFAIENGLMPKEDAEKILKMSQMGGPGGCRGQQECDAYCDQEEHAEECFKFAKESGMMNPEDMAEMEKGMEMFKSMKEMGGPGGCKTPQECDAFCNDQSHMDECMQFSVTSGMMTQEEADRMKNQMQTMEQRMKQMDEQSQMLRQGEMGDCSDGQCEPNGQMPPRGPMPSGDNETLRKMFDNPMFDEIKDMPNQDFGPMPGMEPGQMPPEGFRPPEGMMPGSPSPDGYGGPTQDYKPMPPEGFRPPEGMMPPENQMMPNMPLNNMPFEYGGTTPPGEFAPPSTDFVPLSEPAPMEPVLVEPAPVESLPAIGSIFQPILNLFQL